MLPIPEKQDPKLPTKAQSPLFRILLEWFTGTIEHAMGTCNCPKDHRNIVDQVNRNPQHPALRSMGGEQPRLTCPYVARPICAPDVEEFLHRILGLEKVYTKR